MSTSTAPDKITLDNQTTSPFLLLPPEIRNQIYAYILSGHTIRPAANRNRYYSSTHRPDVQWRRPQSEAFQFRYDIKLLHFLRTCRQIHAEARVLPFSLNVFEGEVDYTMQQAFRDLHIEQAGAVTHIRLRIHRDDLIMEGPITQPILVMQLKSNLRFLIGPVGLRCSSLVEVSLEVNKDVEDDVLDLVEKQFVRIGWGDLKISVDEEARLQRRREWGGKYTR